jgi:hypothetical protein
MAPTTGKIAINIPMASSARGLKEALGKIARKRAVSVSKIVEQILTFAANNPDSFPNEIDKPRSKPGKHISTRVARKVVDGLTEWAGDLGRSRAAHCCFLLECAVNDPKLLEKIFHNTSAK